MEGYVIGLLIGIAAFFIPGCFLLHRFQSFVRGKARASLPPTRPVLGILKLSEQDTSGARYSEVRLMEPDGGSRSATG